MMMPSTNKTPYAELPQFLPSDKPTWLGDVNNAMLKIDGKLSEGNTKNTQQDLQIATALENSANAATAAKEAKTAAESAVAKADAVSARLPVGSADIKDGAVTATKLDSTAMNAILKGMTIKRFSTYDESADNDGMVVPTGVNLEGFYFVEIGLLVVTTFSGKAANLNYISGTPSCYLPSYVQIRVKDGSGLAIKWKSGDAFRNWTGLGVNTNRAIGLNTSGEADEMFVNAGPYVQYAGSPQGAALAGDLYTAYATQNGTVG